MSERILHLLLVDADQVFRLGLRVWLEQFSDLQVVAETGRAATALQVLTRQTSETNWRDLDAEVQALPVPSPRIDLVILDLDLDESDQALGLSLCRQIKARQATLPILLLTQRQELPLLAAAYELGVEGYCLKGMAITELVAIIRRVAEGQKFWDPELQTRILALGDASPDPQPMSSQTGGLWSGVRLRYWLWRSGMQEMEAALSLINAQLQVPRLSGLQRTVLAGRRREILAARWLVNLLLAPAAPQPPADLEPRTQPLTHRPGAAALASGETALLSPEPDAALVTSAAAGPNSSFRNLKAALFEATLSKLQTSLQNLTGKPLEIDILRQEKKRELFYVLLRQLEDILDELRFSQVTPTQLPEKRDRILLDLWQTATADFFGKYYTLRLQKRAANGAVREVEVVAVLLGDAEVVQATVLDRIPLVVEWLEHLLFPAPLVAENRAYAAGSVPATLQAEAILQNLLVQVANGVIQPLLNHFADVEVIKQTFYDRRWISTRELERFRNALSWNFRLHRYLTEPTDIFESQFRLTVLGDRGLELRSIYAPREQELQALTGVRLAVTLALEVRDAIAPPLRSTVAFVGKGVVYLLTQVVGRGIGLIGRGILQGIGSSWQDVRRGSAKK